VEEEQQRVVTGPVRSLNSRQTVAELRVNTHERVVIIVAYDDDDDEEEFRTRPASQPASQSHARVRVFFFTNRRFGQVDGTGGHATPRFRKSAGRPSHAHDVNRFVSTDDARKQESRPSSHNIRWLCSSTRMTTANTHRRRAHHRNSRRVVKKRPYLFIDTRV